MPRVRLAPGAPINQILIIQPGFHSSEIRSLRALVRRVDSLIDMCSQEKNRISTAHESVIVLIKEHIVYLDKEIEKIRKQITDLIGRNPHLKQRQDLLDSIPASLPLQELKTRGALSKLLVS